MKEGYQGRISRKDRTIRKKGRREKKNINEGYQGRIPRKEDEGRKKQRNKKG